MDAEVVYLVSDDLDQARDWVHRNKPRCHAKVFPLAATVGPRGLYINDVPVYVFGELGVDAREAWLQTGARLVHL